MRRGITTLRLCALLALSLLSSSAGAQVSHPLRDGRFAGAVRSYVMATQNSEALQDWYSWALGGRLGYHTAPLHGFGAGVGIYASQEVVGNSERLDPDTGRPSRYELGLYDMADRNHKAVALLGEAYLDFKAEDQLVWFGRHRLNTPLLNPQDGRMIPTLAQGFWYSGHYPAGFGAQAGYLTHIAARGADRFSSVEDSFGLYPVGRNPDGTGSQYQGNIDSKGLLVAALHYEAAPLSVNVWDYFTENVFNAVYADTYLEQRLFELNWRFGVQYLLEQRLRDGGSADPASSYFQQARSQTFGGQIRASTDSRWSVTANYNRVTDEGRFLFPREWGKEPLFVFQKRERSEGSGDLHAFMLQLGKLWDFSDSGKLSSTLGYGHYYRTEPTEPELNKYGFPSLFQANVDTFFHFAEPLDGLSAELLVTYKGDLGASAGGNPNFTLNKVDMLNWNFIVNYEF